MPDRAALITGASSGIGLAIAHMLGEEGHGLTVAARAAAQAMNRELANDGIKSVALCPGFVETPMTEFVREHVKAEDMIRPTDISESVRFLLRLSPNCVVPEIVFQRPDEQALSRKVVCDETFQRSVQLNRD
jgi:NAD(P)-dependent dehydrogenase (short-subunit alcohol dehydrogenase family)